MVKTAEEFEELVRKSIEGEDTNSPPTSTQEERKFNLFYNGIQNTIPNKEIDIVEFLELIKSDTELFKQIRKETDKDKKNILKKKLSYVTFGGTFSKRGNDNLIKSSGLIGLDYDDLENLEECKNNFIKDKYTHCVFITPSGKGLRVIAKIPFVKDDNEYKEIWESITNYYGVPVDVGTKDIARASYLSCDPKPYLNLDSEVYMDKISENYSETYKIQFTKDYPPYKKDDIEDFYTHEAKKLFVEGFVKYLENTPRKKIRTAQISSNNTKKQEDNTRSATEYREVCKLIGKGKTKEEVFEYMNAFSKWSSATDKYREHTYNNAKEYIENNNSKMSLAKRLGFLYDKLDSKGNIVGQEVDIDNVAEYIEDKFQIRTIYGIKEETIEVYQDGIWSVKGRGIIKAEIERLLTKWSKNNVVKEILEKIKRRTEISREETEKIPNFKRCLKNGVLDFEDVDNIKLIPHSKEYNFRTKWDIEYKPNSKCNKYLDLVNEALDKQDIEKFQEWNGFHLVRKYSKKKFAIYHGPKDTSKTVFMNHLTIALNHNVTGLSLQDIARGKAFDLLVLKDKDANICDDLSSSDMKAIGGVKKSVGDGFIDGEQKFGDKIRFPNTAKQTYACNKIPNPGEDIDDSAYYGRIMMFGFENVIPEEKQDPNLISKITSSEELSGWLNWAIEGYKRLVKNNGFSNDLEPQQTKYLMIKNGNSLAEFSSDVLIESAGDKITKDDLYIVYCKWCFEHEPKLSPDSKERIGRNLTKFVPYAQDSKSGSIRYWLNIKLCDTWDTFIKNTSGYLENNKYSNNDNENILYGFLKSVPSASKSDTWNTFLKDDEKINDILEDFE